MQVPPSMPSFDPGRPSGEPQPGYPALAATIMWAGFSLLLVSLLAVLLTRPGPRSRFLPALIVTFSFAIAARLLRGVTLSGAAAGFLVTLILYVADGAAMFGAVLVVFVLTYLATRFGRTRKQSRAIAERSGGRDAAQVFANIGCAALIAAVAPLLSIGPYLALNLAPAALAEAAADTVSSEIGKSASGTARMITSWRLVSAGTNGAISLWGSVAGIVAAALVGTEIYFTRSHDPRAAIVTSVAGVLGMFFDSLLGATLENRGMLTNNAVNLLSTAFSILAAMLLATFL